MSQKLAANIDVSYNVALITICNIPDDIRLISDIFTSIADKNINIQMISKTLPYREHVNISFCIPSEDLLSAITTINNYRGSAKEFLIEADPYNTKVSVYCEKTERIPGFVAKLLKLSADETIHIKLITSSESEINCLVHEYDSDRFEALVITAIMQ